MTHGAFELAPRAAVLTGGFACYAIYGCADERRLALAALEPAFFARLCALIERPELAPRQYGDRQAELGTALAAVFETRPLEDWLRLFEDEDVCVAPIATREEASADLGMRAAGTAPPVGAHTDAWRHEVGL